MPFRSTALLLAALCTAAIAAGCSGSSPGAASPSADARAQPYRIDTIATGLDHPWSLAFLPDGRALVSERPGRLRLIVDGKLRPAPLAGLPAALYVEGSNGPMDIALDPGFADNGLLYIAHGHGSADANTIRVTRARLAGERLVDVRAIFDASPRKPSLSNVGGRIAFLDDGTLLLTIGDAFALREQAQDPMSHLGKTLRITRDGGVPRDNPFVGRPGHLPEIYTLGHRNAQGVTVVGGDAWLSEHGPRGGDELNRLRPGANYGWPVTTHGIDYTWARVTPYATLPGIEAPVAHWVPSVAPSGLMHYGGGMFPAWRGSFLMPTLAERSVRRIRIDAGGRVAHETLFTELDARIRDARQAPDGALWLLVDGADGRVLRVSKAG